MPTLHFSKPMRQTGQLTGLLLMQFIQLMKTLLGDMLCCLQRMCCCGLLPLHARSNIVQQALSILVLCGQSVFDYKLTLLKGQLLVKLNNLDIIGTFACFSIFRRLQESNTLLADIYLDGCHSKRPQQSWTSYGQAKQQRGTCDHRMLHRSVKKDLRREYGLSRSDTPSLSSLFVLLLRAKSSQRLERLATVRSIVAIDMFLVLRWLNGVSECLLSIPSRRESKALLLRHATVTTRARRGRSIPVNDA